MTRPLSQTGFTLMELIVVIVIISIMLIFAIPEFSGKIIRDDTELSLNWIVFNVSKLKKDARYQAKDLFMCINRDTNTISVKNRFPDLDGSDSAVLSEFLLPGDVCLDGVEFNNIEQETNNDGCIQFYKKGYSDQAIIHISDNDGKEFSCFIHPFLHRVTIQKGHLGFE